MIYTILKHCFQNTESKLLNYRNLESCSPQAFEEYFSETLLIVVIHMINLKRFLPHKQLLITKTLVKKKKKMQ